MFILKLTWLHSLKFFSFFLPPICSQYFYGGTMKLKHSVISFLLLSEVVSAGFDPASAFILLAPSVISAISGKGEGDLSPTNFGNMLSSKKQITLEEIVFSVEEDLNNRGAVRVHLVLVYTKELKERFTSLDSRKYFEDFEQIIKDNPDKIKILEWKICAERRTFSWKKSDESAFAPPKAAFVFVSYNTLGNSNYTNNSNYTYGGNEHRAVVPINCKKIKIILEREDFKLKRVKDDEEDEEDSIGEES